MTDEQAMEAVKKGDLAQSALLFERYHRPIFNFFLKQNYDKEASEDMTQQVFLRLLKYRSSYQKGKSFRPWVYQIARNVRASYYKGQVAKKDQFADIESVTEELAGNAESLEQADRERQLHRALAQLGEEDRELLNLSRFQQLKYEEISTLTGYSVGAIKVKIHRAIKKLKGIYFMVGQE